MSTLSNHWHSLIFFMDEALRSISPFGSGQLVKIFIILEPHGIFGSNFAYLFILTLSSHKEASGLSTTGILTYLGGFGLV